MVEIKLFKLSKGDLAEQAPFRMMVVQMIDIDFKKKELTVMLPTSLHRFYFVEWEKTDKFEYSFFQVDEKN